MSETEDNNDDNNVEVFQRINHLKRKAGVDPNTDAAGAIPQDAIDNADAQISTFCDDCVGHTKEALENLLGHWDQLKKQQNDKELLETMFNDAHQIKDIAGMCGYTLICDFAESLRDYLHETKLDQDAHIKITQAHVDVITLAYKDEVKDDGGPLALELRSLLKKAIDQYG